MTLDCPPRTETKLVETAQSAPLQGQHRPIGEGHCAYLTLCSRSGTAPFPTWTRALGPGDWEPGGQDQAHRGHPSTKQTPTPYYRLVCPVLLSSSRPHVQSKMGPRKTKIGREQMFEKWGAQIRDFSPFGGCFGPFRHSLSPKVPYERPKRGQK